MQTLSVLVVLFVAVAIFLTTPMGRRLTARLGLRFSHKGGAPQEDRDYLLRVCNGDTNELRARLATARQNNPDMTDAEAYRRAIRAHLRNKV